TGVSADTAVRATFDVTMDASTVNDQTFTLADSGGNAVAGSVGYDESTRTATFTPSSSLHSGTAYTARLSTGVRSDDETPLAAPVAWSFATVGPAPPAVTSASPVDGASLISPDGAVTATFDQAMKASTITSSSFTLSAPSGDVTAAVAY